MIKSREGSLKFFLFPGRKSIYLVKNGKRGLNIFREVGGGNDDFLERRKVFRRGAYWFFIIIFTLFLNNFFVWDARLVVPVMVGEIQKDSMGSFNLLDLMREGFL